MDWFRLYHNFCTNLKTRRLSWEQRGVIIAGWCIASRSPVRGRLYIADGVPAGADDLADEAKLSPQFVAAAIGTPEHPGYLCPAWFTWQQGALIAHDWDARQFRSDDVTERTRRHKQKSQSLGNVPGNVPGNAQGTPRGRSGERPGNAQGTPPDTETDTDTENKRAAANRAPARVIQPDPPAAPLSAATQLACSPACSPVLGAKEFPWWEVFERTFGLTRVPELQAEVLRQWSREGMESAVIERGFRMAIEAKARLPAKWTVSTLAPLYAAGVRTMEQAEMYWQERQTAEEENRHARSGRSIKRSEPGREDWANAPRHPLEGRWPDGGKTT